MTCIAYVALVFACARGWARECGIEAEAAACTSNAECRCGANTISGGCQTGAAECIVETVECGAFCTGLEQVVSVCRSGRCIRAQPICGGDCDADARVGIAEVVAAVGIALGERPLAACGIADSDGDTRVTISELIVAVRAALDGCSVPARNPAARRIEIGACRLRGIRAVSGPPPRAHAAACWSGMGRPVRGHMGR